MTTHQHSAESCATCRKLWEHGREIGQAETRPVTPGVNGGIMGAMPQSSPARALADKVAALAPNSLVVDIPKRGVEWAPRVDVRLEQAERRAELEAELGALERPPGVHVVVQGVCRIMLGGRSGLRGSGERVTGLVVHVVADGEPIHTVLMPLE